LDFPCKKQDNIEEKGGQPMERGRQSLDVRPIKGGWAALGDGWAVHGKTKEEAVRLYHEAIERHKEIDARPVEMATEEAEA
jgi:hypothetical protein